jgi:hypothetical protein
MKPLSLKLFAFFLTISLFYQNSKAQSVLITPSKSSHSDSLRVEKSLIMGNSGKVGIGTDEPTQKLHVEGSQYISEKLGIGVENPTHSLEVNGNLGIIASRLVFEDTGLSTFIGANAGVNSDLGQNLQNVFIGTGSGQYNTTGYSNVYIGNNSGRENEEGHENVAIGENALGKNKGYANTAIGKYALDQNVNGNENFALGNYAGYGSDGNQNIFLGSGNGESMTGSGNVFIGNQVGANETLNNTLLIHNTTSSTPLIKGNFANKTLTINGSLNVTGQLTQSVKSAQEAGSDHPNNTASIWIYTLNVGNLNLPSPSSSTGFTYTLVNKTGAVITLSTAYKDMSNANSTTIVVASSITIVSDGTDWQQIR